MPINTFSFALILRFLVSAMNASTDAHHHDHIVDDRPFRVDAAEAG